MSRILRRPMFRGGRVDSRGTGITSGLSYKKGGRVGYDNGGLTFDQRQNVIDFKKRGGAKYTEDLIRDRFNKYMDNLYTGDISDVDIAYGMQIIPPMSTKEMAIQEEFQEDPDKAYGLFKTGEFDDINYADLQKKEMEIAKLAGLDMTQYGEPEKKEVKEKTPDQLRIEELEQFILDQAKPKKLTEDEKLAEIEKKKKMFEKVYGSGVADEASTMALSLAGKLLKPGATVKSGFGEFFEAEAGRPSTRKKYLDAAAQAAIQSFLTGETSYQKFQDDLLAYSNKLNLKGKADKEALKDMTLAQIAGATRNQGTSASAKRKQDAQTWLDYRREEIGPKFVNEFNSKKADVKDLFIEEYVGEFFLDQQTGEFFEIIRLEDGTIGKARRG